METTRFISKERLLLLVFAFSLFSFHSQAFAADSIEHKSYLLAQSDPDEAYDPFTDYSEFDEESDEEADINFFRNGRFFTIGLMAGYRGFTGNFAKVYDSNVQFGLFLSYFFDLSLALQLGFQTGDHAVNFSTLSGSTRKYYNGNLSMTAINFDLKYYMNTQNVTRGLADLNPYLLGGLGQFYRTYTIADIDGYSRDSAMGVNIGAGVEIPLMRKKAYLGLQAVYHYVNFNDESKSYVQGTEKLEQNISGDTYDLSVILGMNF